jgi:23S rRNA (cytidine1920-2'-O)/16S rRNA (cytidine1409-2'-O)-methyltransferase
VLAWPGKSSHAAAVMPAANPCLMKHRLDEELVARGLMPSRARARDAILRGTAEVNGARSMKPSQRVSANDAITLNDAANAYVSRAALKLIAGLHAWQFSVEGKIALDIGASTGGFTQVLLEQGAAKVHAIDVGHGQLHPMLAGDPRVMSQEGLNARDLTGADLGGDRPDVIVCDASFISLKLVLPPALDLAAPGAMGVFLVKPQFEAGRSAIGKNGILKNPQDAWKTASDLHDWLNGQPGWRALDVMPAPITGGDGNQEYLLGGVKDA